MRRPGFIRRHAGRLCLTATLLVVMCFSPISEAAAGDRTNVPLKNWGGFSEFYDATYDDLERLVTAGLADRVLLNTRPLSRLEAAKIVARAIEKIRSDETGGLNARRDLEPVLNRLMEEFKVELASLGVRISEGPVSPERFVSFIPIDRAQTFLGYASRQFSLVNDQGHAFKRGANGGLTFESRARIGDFLSFYVQPELLENQDYGAARLATGYAKLTLYNVELLVGRDSLAWGPGYHNALLLSNNAAPLDQIRLGAAEPFLLPWVGQWVGPTKAMIFLAQLEERRDHSFAKLSGIRLTFAPFSFLELGAGRTVLFDGGGPYLPLRKYPSAIFNPGFGGVGSRPEERTDNLVGLDADLRLRNVDRYFLPSRDLRLYGEFYWDDTCGECGPSSGIGHWFAGNLLPEGSTTGGVGGVHLMGLFGQDWLDGRLEYARTSPLSLNHFQFEGGYWTRGHVISDFIGTDGRDYFGRLAARFTSNLMVGLDIDRAIIGSTVDNFPSPQQRRLGGGIDVSYRFWERYSLFAQYVVSDVKNRQFRAGDNGFDHLIRLELTRSFR